MAEEEIFESAIRSTGDKAGVFEYTDNTGYFYLYEMKKNQKVMAAVRMVVGQPGFTQEDIVIRWDSDETIVGLFIYGKLWAAFDSRTGAKFGGDYDPNNPPKIPDKIIKIYRD